MITIYHNSRCSKSREGLCLLEDLGKDIKVVNYLQDQLSYEELSKIIEILGIAPIDLVRTKEVIWKENFKDKILSDKEIIEAMVLHPKLIERPIVINEGKGVIGRPTELINTII